MTSQDYRVQDSRYRPDDFADDPRRDRYEESRRYQSSRRELQAGYGRGRDFGPREFYARESENSDRRYGEPSGRARFEEDYAGGEGGFAGRDYRDYRDYNDRGREPRFGGVADLEAFGRRSANPYQQGGGYRAAEYAYGASRDPRFAGDAELRDAFAQGDQGARLRWLAERGAEGPSWAGGGGAIRDEYARYHGLGPKNYKRSDERIREDVSDHLSDDPYVDASEIEVNVHNSEVTLSGAVENRIQRRRAELAAEQVSGVSHIQNNLRVKPANAGGRHGDQASGSADAGNAPKVAAQAR
jgi:BON domain